MVKKINAGAITSGFKLFVIIKFIKPCGFQCSAQLTKIIRHPRPIIHSIKQGEMPCTPSESLIPNGLSMLERHILRMKRIYGKRRAHLISSLTETFGNKVLISGDAAGLHLIATQPGRNADLLTAIQLKEHNIKVYPAERYTIYKDKYNESLIMGFGNVTESQIT